MCFIHGFSLTEGLQLWYDKLVRRVSAVSFLPGGENVELQDLQWDQKLKINTVGLDETHTDLHHNRYEATPYGVLNRLVEQGFVPRESYWIDYGCGKGRVGLFLNKMTGCRVTGVEFQEALWQCAIENCRTSGAEGVRFVCGNAERFGIEDADHFYFFSPFSVPILQRVMNRILQSYYENPRRLRFFFYYPTEEYAAELMHSELVFVEKVDCRDLFPVEDSREHILIFEMPGLQSGESVL